LDLVIVWRNRAKRQVVRPHSYVMSLLTIMTQCFSRS
jgi:hypothetical protein